MGETTSLLDRYVWDGPSELPGTVGVGGGPLSLPQHRSLRTNGGSPTLCPNMIVTDQTRERWNGTPDGTRRPRRPTPPFSEDRRTSFLTVPVNIPTHVLTSPAVRDRTSNLMMNVVKRSSLVTSQTSSTPENDSMTSHWVPGSMNLPLRPVSRPPSRRPTTEPRHRSGGPVPRISPRSPLFRGSSGPFEERKRPGVRHLVTRTNATPVHSL